MINNKFYRPESGETLVINHISYINYVSELLESCERSWEDVFDWKNSPPFRL